MNNAEPFQIHDREIVALEGQRFQAPFPIKMFLPFKNVVVILLDPMAAGVPNENVIGLSRNLDFIWQIKPRHYFNPSSPYTFMRILDGKLTVYGWDSVQVNLDLSTGNIIREHLSK